MWCNLITVEAFPISTFIFSIFGSHQESQLLVHVDGRRQLRSESLTRCGLVTPLHTQSVENQGPPWSSAHDGVHRKGCAEMCLSK